MAHRTLAFTLGTLVVAAALSVGTGAETGNVREQSGALINQDTVTVIDVPDSTSNFPLDINAAGVIVGRYVTGGQTHGFLRSPAGDFTTIDVPGASFTATTSVNNDGDIVGQYALPGAPAERHGFLLKNGEFTYFDPPGSRVTNVLGINERGDIVGRYCTLAKCTMPGTGVFGGFLLRDGEFTAIDVPGAIETDAIGINGREQIAGGFVTGQDELLFVLDNGAFTLLAPPGGLPVALDKASINDRGDIVGAYCDGAAPCAIALTGGAHGFLMSAGAFTSIDIPGAIATAATGINARGDIVGGYSDGTRFHGFLLTQSVYQGFQP